MVTAVLDDGVWYRQMGKEIFEPARTERSRKVCRFESVLADTASPGIPERCELVRVILMLEKFQ